MKNRNRVAVAAFEDRHHLRRERDFGHHHDHLAAALQHFVDQAQKHRGLAAARDAVKQRGAAAVSEAFQQMGKRRLLMRRERNVTFGAAVGHFALRHTVQLAVGDFDHAFFLQRGDDRNRHACKIAKLLYACRADIKQHIANAKLLFRQSLRQGLSVREGLRHARRFDRQVAERFAGFVVALHQPFLHKALQHIAVALQFARFEHLVLAEKADLAEHIVINGRFRFVQRGAFFGLQRNITYLRFQMKAGRKLHTRRFKQRAERALLEKQRKAQHFLGKQRRIVQHGKQLFIAFSDLRRRKIEHKPLPFSAAVAEADQHAAAFFHFFTQLLRHKITVKNVKMICNIFHRNKGKKLFHIISHPIFNSVYALRCHGSPPARAAKDRRAKTRRAHRIPAFSFRIFHAAQGLPL